MSDVLRIPTPRPERTTSGETPVAKPTPERTRSPQPPPSLTVNIGTERIVFLVTELLRSPELDTLPTEKCSMCFRVMPGLLLSLADPRIICPLIVNRRKALHAEAQLLQVARELENPYYGLSMFAKLTQIPDYRAAILDTPHTYLPVALARQLFPQQIAALPDAETLSDSAPILIHLRLPTGHHLPEVYAGRIVRLSLNSRSRTGGLAPNGQSLLVNSRIYFDRIHLPAAGFTPPADDFYRLQGSASELPVSSVLPERYEDWRDALDPNAALLDRIAAYRS